MRLTEKFQVLQQAQKELDLSTVQDSLERMQRSYNDKKYYVAFIGRFSAGKSRLLNNLIGHDVLPSGVRETTPVLTYIGYGEENIALVHDLTGNIREIAIDNVASMTQVSKEWSQANVDWIELRLPIPMLAKGMVLIDTPGIDTIIKRHNDLLASSLAAASRIVYVTSGAPTKRDIELIRDLTESGFSILSVRTHCDEIKVNEESGEKVQDIDRKVLSAAGLNQSCCYFVSNLNESEWYTKIDSLGQLLTAVGQDVEASLENDINAQLKALARKTLPMLNEKRQLLEDTAADNKEALERRRHDYDLDIRALQVEADRRRSELQSRVETTQREITTQIHAILENEILVRGRDIASSTTTNSEKDMLLLWRHETREFIRHAYKLLNGLMEPVILKINGPVKLEGLHVEESLLPQAENYTQIVEAQDTATDYLRAQLTMLQNNKETLERVILEDNEEDMGYFTQQLEQLHSELRLIQNQKRELGEYEPQYIEMPGTEKKASRIGRIVGEVIDWALFFLPGKTITKIAEKSVKGVAKVAPKLAKWTTTATESIVKASKTIGIADTAKDVAFAAKKVHDANLIGSEVELPPDENNKKRNNSQTKTLKAVNKVASVLDMLSVGHWIEKACKPFDKPPRMQIDLEHKRIYEQTEQELRQRELTIQQELYRTNKQMGLYKTKRADNEAFQASLLVDEARIKSELSQREAEIRSKAKKASLISWRKDCARVFETHMRANLDAVLNDYTTGMFERLEQYQENRLHGIAEQIERAQAEYNAIVSEPNKAADHLAEIEKLIGEVERCLD